MRPRFDLDIAEDTSHFSPIALSGECQMSVIYSMSEGPCNAGALVSLFESQDQLQPEVLPQPSQT